MSNETGEVLITIIKVVATIIAMFIGAFVGAFIGAFKAPFYIGLFNDSSFEPGSIKEKIITGMKDKI